jgi:hypothetical protein
MRVRSLSLSICLLAVAAHLLACTAATTAKDEAPAPVPDIEARRAQFAQFGLTASLEHLSGGDRAALEHLVRAADWMDVIFKRQAWAGHEDFEKRVATLKGPGAQAAKDYYRIMYGPWDRLLSHEPFLGDLEHPEGAGYYPEDMTKEEFDAWIAAHPEDEESFKGLFTMIVRSEGGLEAVSYHEFFKNELSAARDELLGAAGLADTPSLKTYLRSRAEAFLSDDYYQSDMDWMDLDGNLEIVIGPYETYEDGLFGYKAAFEAFLCVVDPDDSAALAKYKGELPWLELQLPIPDEHKNLDRGSESPISVTDEIYTAGDTRSGIQTIAFNLPNDERVREAKGSKKVLLKNIMRAKYENILVPIARHALPEADVARASWDAYFNFVLFHELCHGLGPGRITVDGRETEVRLELRDLYSSMEEAKADVMGIWALYQLADKGIMDEKIVDSLAWTVVPGLLRSARFGVTEAHGLGVVCQFSYLIEKGAIEVTADQRLRPVLSKWRGAVTDLTHDLCMLEATGDYEATQKFVEKYGPVPPAMQSILDSLGDIPVDIDPVYPTKGS